MLSWSSDFDVHGRAVNSAGNRKFETRRQTAEGNLVAGHRFERVQSAQRNKKPRRIPIAAVSFNPLLFRHAGPPLNDSSLHTGMSERSLNVGRTKCSMITVPLKIVRFISDANREFVAGELVDSYGRVHTFEDKVVMIALGSNPRADCDFPCDGILACTILNRWIEEDGRELVRICTGWPWDDPSTDGEYHFVVLAEQVSER